MLGPIDPKFCKISAVHKMKTPSCFLFKLFSVIFYSIKPPLNVLFLSLCILRANCDQKQKLPKFTHIFGPNIDRNSKNIFKNKKPAFSK